MLKLVKMASNFETATIRDLHVLVCDGVSLDEM